MISIRKNQQDDRLRECPKDTRTILLEVHHTEYLTIKRTQKVLDYENKHYKRTSD